MVKITVITFHVDQDFTQSERDEIQNAMTEWFGFSGGSVVFNASWGYDMHNVKPLPAGEWYLVRLTSQDALTKQWDDEIGGEGSILGRVSDIGASQGVLWLIADRTEGGDFKAVAMHELGHVVGMRHLAQPRTIMSAGHSPGVVEFTAADKRQCLADCLCLL
jgi:hypothetical protein